MKMTKIESARIVAKQKGYCSTVHCKDCFITEKCYKVDEKTSDVLQRFMSAEAYIKRHESKTKKKDHILDTTKKVTRPNFRKYLRDKIDVTPDAESNVKAGGKAYTADEKYRNFYKALFSKQTFFVRADENIKKDLCYYGVLMKWKSTVKYPVELQDPFLIFDYVNQANRLMYTTNDPDIVKDYPEYDAEKDTLVGFAKERSTKVTRPNFRKYLRDKIDMKVRVTPELILELEKICKDEGVYHWNGHGFIEYGDNPYMLLLNGAEDCEYSVVFSYKGRENTAEYNPKTDTLKVEEPKPIKTVGIDNSDVTLALTAQHEPTPLQIAKMIRDDRYRCLKVANCKGCPLRLVRNCGNGTEFAINEERKLRRQLIDDYISANEHVKDCPVNSEYPQPTKLPDFVYSASKNGVGFIDTKNRTFNTNDKGELLINDKPCFATPEEALQVAKKLWNGDGK